MYIVKCDRCGKEKTVKNILPVFGQDKPKHVPKYMISSFGEDGANMIYLCEKCEEDFTAFLAEKALEDDSPIITKASQASRGIYRKEDE